MNPNSNYYLAINTGFPNVYDRANERTGALLTSTATALERVLCHDRRTDRGNLRLRGNVFMARGRSSFRRFRSE
jgi:hypothetical protein